MKLKKLLAGIAPALASALGGPFAGSATKVLANKFLGKDNATEEELLNVLTNSSPTQLGEIKTLNNNFLLEMGKQGVDIFELETKDVQDAREAGETVKMIPQMVLSTVFIIGYFALIFLLFSGKFVLDAEMLTTGNILLGVLTASMPQIMGFWFGSSHGSKTKIKK